MKIKVHAQRKFAQGAFIPPNAAANQADRRTDAAPARDEIQHVYFSRMSAASLLDTVAFQSMHSHKEPVVILERLEEIQDSIGHPPVGVNGAYSSALRTTANGNLRSKLAKSLRYTRAKRTSGLNQRVQRPLMHLRTRLGSTFKPKRQTVKKKVIEKARVGTRATRRNRVPSPAGSYDQDDDKPLTYIAQVLRRTVELRSDKRNLRKRRGEELPSTSKRRARVNIPTRQQKPTKPRVQTAAICKNNYAESDSDDDTNTGTTNGPTKPKLNNASKSSPSNVCNDFKVNEGASTSKQKTVPPWRKDIGNISAPYQTASTSIHQGLPTIQSNNYESETLRTIQNNDFCVNNSLTKTAAYQNNDLEVAKPAQSTVQSLNLGLSSTQVQPTVQNTKLKSSIQGQATSKNIDLAQPTGKNNYLTQPTSQNNDLNQPTSQNKDVEPKNSSQDQAPSPNNGIKLRSSSRAQPTSQNILKLRSSSRVQSTVQNKINEHKTNSVTQSLKQTNNVDIESCSQAQTTSVNNNSLKLRSTMQVELTVQNNTITLGSNLRTEPSTPDNTLDNAASSQAQTTSQNDINLNLRSSSQRQPTIIINGIDLGGGPQAQPTSQIPPIPNHSSTTQTQITSQNNDLNVSSSSWTPPSVQNNNQGPPWLRSKTQNNYLQLTSDSSQAQLTTTNNDRTLTTESLVTQPTTLNNELKLKSSSQSQPMIQINDLGIGGSTQVLPKVQNNDLVLKGSLPAPLTGQNIDVDSQGSLLAQPTSQDNDNEPTSSSQAQPTTKNDNTSPTGSSQTQRTGLNNQSNIRGSPQPQITTIHNDLGVRDGSQARPTIQNNAELRNNGMGRLAFENNDLDLRRNLLAELMFPNDDLDLLMNSRPLTAIQNYDWDFSGSRSRTTPNNFFGLPANFRTRPVIHPRPNSRAQLAALNQQLRIITEPPPPARVAGIPQGTNSRSWLQTNSPVASTAQSTSRNDETNTSADPKPSTSQNKPETSGAGNTTTGPKERSPPRPLVRNDIPHANSMGFVRTSFRNVGHYRPRSMLLNDEIRPRPKPRPTARSAHRTPFPSIRDQARYWSPEGNGSEKTRELQSTADSLAAMNKARADRLAAAAADRERAFFLDEALRECVLTAQSVAPEKLDPYDELNEEEKARNEKVKEEKAKGEKPNEEKAEETTNEETANDEKSKKEKVKEEKAKEKKAFAMKKCYDLTGIQKRQAIAARQQQLSEGSPMSRRNAPRRIPQTDLGVNGQNGEKETGQESSKLPDSEAEPEPGLSKVQKKKWNSSPVVVLEAVCGLPNRSSVSKPQPEKGPQRDPVPGLSKVLRKKPAYFGDPITTRGQERESVAQTDKQPKSGPESDQGSLKGRKKKPNNSSGDLDPQTATDNDSEPQSGPSKLRRKNVQTLLGGMMQRSRLRAPERLPQTALRKTAAGERTAQGTKPQEPENGSKAPTSKTAESSSGPSAMSMFLKPELETNDNDDKVAKVAPVRTPIVEGWLNNVLIGQPKVEVAHFKVPRIPAARKSLDKRTAKPQESERDNTQISPATELIATEPQVKVEEEEPTSTASTLATNTGTAKVFVTRLQLEKPNLSSRERLPEPFTEPENECLSKHLTTVRSIVHATDGELADRCGHCLSCTRVGKIRRLSDLVQNQRKPAATTNEVYDFDAEREDSHDNTRLYNFRQNRKAKLHESASEQDAPKDPVYLDVLPPENPHIIEITSVRMPNQNKPMLRARLIRKTDANLANEFSLIEHENLLDQLLEIKIAITDQAAKKTALTEPADPVAGPSTASLSKAGPVNDPDDTESEVESDVELCDETDDSETELAGLQTRLVTRKKAEQTNRGKATFKTNVVKRTFRSETKKPEPTKKTKNLKKGQVEATQVEPPRNYISYNFSRCFREAPIFYPTEDEFLDPLVYFEKIYPLATQFGLCKVVAPPGFKPKCTITDDVRFNVANQYISRLFCRWGAAAKEMCAIKAYLAEQKVFFNRPPLIDGIELNLPKLYRTVQRHGGLKNVIEKKRWARVAEEMRFPRGPRSAKRIDQLYVKYLLPYDTLSSAERRELMVSVEFSWYRNYKKMLNRASKPLHRQKRLMGDSESSDEMDTDEDAHLAFALAEAEDCVVTGRCMNLSVFKKVATNAMWTLFPHSAQPTPKEVEREYWTLVSGAAEHVCVNAASIDTGEEGYGFPRAKTDPYSKHPWNLKMFSKNSRNVLRSLGPVLGVTVPTLHLGMVFSTSCWHRDPHGLPWVEYMHQGPPKIWYGIPDELSAEFRKAVETLCPTSCQNKSIWLPSDITMIPPHLLQAADVPLSRVVQKPGEFIFVCPKAYSSSIATGYTESESVYFAPTQWLSDVSDVFKELRASCEPTMFSLAQLLLAVALDERTPEHVLADVLANLQDVVAVELERRETLAGHGVRMVGSQVVGAGPTPSRPRPAGAWNVREQDECEVCRTTLYLSKVTGLTSKRSSLCLEHAILLLEKEKLRNPNIVDEGEIVATIFVVRPDLEGAVRYVEERLRNH